MKPVMWAGLPMMTLIPALLIYFGWWTKAAVAGVVVLAHTLPGHGAFILLSGLGIFGFVALLVLYAYHGPAGQGPGWHSRYVPARYDCAALTWFRRVSH